jgi:hypothetical protein
VDFYISGCPPRPDAVLNVLIQLQKKIERDRSWRLALKNPEAEVGPAPAERAAFGGNRHGPPVSLATRDERFVEPGPQKRLARGRPSPEAR